MTLKSYIGFFQREDMGIICAAAHAVGLLTMLAHNPGILVAKEQKQVCQKAVNICKEANIELGKLTMYHYMQLEGPAFFLIAMQTRKHPINLEAVANGLTKKEQEVSQLLKETLVEMIDVINIINTIIIVKWHVCGKKKSFKC